MTEQQQAACAELARRIGWREGELAGIWFPPDGNLKRVQTDPPEYFTNHAASRELVRWLAKTETLDEVHRGYTFFAELMSKLDIDPDMEFPVEIVMTALTAPLPVIARAACKALGIEVSE